MITLRHFTEKDTDCLQKHMYPDMTPADIACLLKDWESLSYQGQYFEMLAVESDGALVGNASLREQAAHVISLGIEIFPEERGKGYACGAVEQLCRLGSAKGYQVALDQVRADNIPSIKLHEKLGFERTVSTYQNAKGKEVFLFIKLL